MLPADVATILYGLTAAVTWGTGDFSGGLASKRTHAVLVVLLSQCLGTLILCGVTLWLAEPLPPGGDMLIGAAAGVAGVVALIAFYQALARYQMGTVAPVTAAISAVVPVGIGAVLEGMPGTPQLLGFTLALLAVWLITWTRQGVTVPLRSLTLPVIAGLGFAGFFIAMDQASHTAVLWPVVGARGAASILLAVVVGCTRRRWTKPARQEWPLIAVAGIFDTAGNTFFALAARAGRLDMAAILASFYPATTVLLAWMVLKERLTVQQWCGVVMVLAAVVLMAL